MTKIPRATSSTSKSRAQLPKGCRAYQRRTVDCVSTAVASWKAIFELPVPDLEWSTGSCSDLARVVKKYLATEVSSEVAAQMGFQSIKKLLPDSCRCMESGMLDDLVSRLGRKPPGLPSGYLHFVKTEVSRLFPKGWDAPYEGHCLTVSPPIKACIGGARSTGGALEKLAGREGEGTIGQSAYLDAVLHGKGRLCPRYCGEMLVVQSAGKPRPLSKFPAEALYLKPLHKTIYGSLSTKKWLLRGPPTREVLAKAGFRQGGGVLVSGDYKSATDNLPIEVMEAALGVMLDNARFVPSNVGELARRACRPILFSEKDSFEVKTGQMMGSLLSFPFLCLQNYLAFRWALRSSGRKGFVPVLINGDDILFQADRSFASDWFAVVSRVGLEVEVTKTSVEEGFGSLNSTLLEWRDGLLSPSWSPRFGMLRPAEHPGALGKSFLDFLSGSPAKYRFRAGKVWFKWHIGELRSTGLSLPSLGFRGCLAMRLSYLFNLHRLPTAELPAFFHSHGVRMLGDFVSLHATESVDAELSAQSAVEVCAAKWSIGMSYVDRTSAAIRYCMDRTAVKCFPYDYPSVEKFLVASSSEIDFLSRNGRRVVEETRSRRRKAFLAPFPVANEVILASSVVAALVADFGRGDLPPYSEFPLPGELTEAEPGVCRG